MSRQCVMHKDGNSGILVILIMPLVRRGHYFLVRTVSKSMQENQMIFEILTADNGREFMNHYPIILYSLTIFHNLQKMRKRFCIFSFHNFMFLAFNGIKFTQKIVSSL